MPSTFLNDSVLIVDQRSIDAMRGAGFREIVAWGDSLTAGNVSGLSNSYPTLLSDVLEGRTVINAGVGGQTSAQIAARMLLGNQTFNDTVVIWAGRNSINLGPDVIEADIARMVSALGANQHYIVLSVLNSERAPELRGASLYNDILRLNSDLAATYAGHYLDVRSILVSKYDASRAADILDFQNDVVPTSLRIDTLHLNRAGNAVVADAVADFINKTLDGPPLPRFSITGAGALVTASSELDLIGFDTYDNVISTSNAIGTAFRADNINTAVHTFGGSGFDTLLAQSSDAIFTSSEIGLIFSHGIEEVVDANGTHFFPGALLRPIIGGVIEANANSAAIAIRGGIATLFGTAAPLSQIKLFVSTPTTSIRALTVIDVDQGGNWASPFNASSDGKYVFSAYAFSGADRSPTSNFFSLTFDNSPPVAPDIGAIFYDTGLSSSDGVTYYDHVRVQGTGEPLSAIHLLLDGTEVGQTQVKPGGTWNFDNPSMVASEGSHILRAFSVDAAGNESASDSFSLVVDKTGPSAPRRFTVSNSIKVQTGVYTLTSDHFEISGLAEPFGYVRVTRGGEAVGVASVDASGQWSFDYDAVLDAGLYRFAFRAVDLAGNAGGVTTLRIVVDSPASTPFQIKSVFIKDGRYFVSSDGGAFHSITFSEGDTLSYKTQAGATGHFTTELGSLANVPHSFDLYDTDTFGTSLLNQGKLVIGSTNADTLVGTSGADYIFAGAGNDVIDGAGGADIIRTGAGRDTVILHAGEINGLAIVDFSTNDRLLIQGFEIASSYTTQVSATEWTIGDAFRSETLSFTNAASLGQSAFHFS